MRILLEGLSCCCCVNKRKMATSFVKAICDKINICDTGPLWTYTQNLKVPKILKKGVNFFFNILKIISPNALKMFYSIPRGVMMPLNLPFKKRPSQAEKNMRLKLFSRNLLRNVQWLTSKRLLNCLA